MPEVRVLETLEAVGQDRWNALFPDELEGFEYLLAVEQSGLEGFAWRYVVVEEAGELRAAAPAFLNAYALDTTLTGAPKRWLEAVRRVAPAPLTLRLACLGSPCTETAQLGFAPGLDAQARRDLLRALVQGWEQYAATGRHGLLAVKDVPVCDQDPWEAELRERGYRSAPGLACASLDIDFDSLDVYLARLSTGARRDMRRKLKKSGRVHIEVRQGVSDILDEMMPIYAATRARAEMAFEDLTPAYFQGVVDNMGSRALCVEYRVDGELMAFNLLLQGDGLLLDKFFCMKPEGRAHDLYYVSWFHNLSHCLEHKLSRYQSGQAAYANKLRLGSRLTANRMWFRHRNPVLNTMLRLGAPLLAPGDEDETHARTAA